MVLTVSMVTLKTKFEGGPLDRGLNLYGDGLGLCKTVVIAGYIAYI